jgi:exodeoxyribonuclease VII large subunit
MEKSTIYSLSSLAKLVEWTFTQMFDDFLFRCKADVWSIKKYWSRYYVDLFEYDWLWSVKTKITGIVRNASLLETFLRTTHNTIDSLVWKEVMLQWYFSYSVKWWLSISILAFSQQFEQGQQRTALEVLTNELKEKKLYTANASKQLPAHPKHIAVISSKTSQWLKDFLSILQDSSYQFQPVLFPAFVEWDKAIQSVSQALHRIETIQTTEQCFDCVVIVRGWGWSEWFHWQNSKEIAYCVAEASLPVIVAIWHTSDRSILDEIAYKSSKTPSEAAAFLVEHVTLLDQQLTQTYKTICRRLIQHYNNLEQSVEQAYMLIQTVSIQNMLNLWYALIKQQKSILSQEQIAHLKAWEQLEIETAQKIITVTIKTQQNK